MNPKLIRTLLFSLCIFSFFAIKAKQAPAGGTISGVLIDAANTQPLELATVSVVRKSDNHPVKSMQTDLQGNFSLSGIDDGVYQFRASYVSYLTFIKDTIRIGGAKRTINLGDIK